MYSRRLVQSIAHDLCHAARADRNRFMSTVLFQCPWDDDGTWAKTLRSAAPDLDIRTWPETGPAEDVDTALVWKPPPELLTGLPRLRLLHSLGAGVDHIFAAGPIPTGVTVARLVDPVMADRMAEYVVAAVLRYHRRFDVYARQQAESLWRHAAQKDAADVTVGILGLGALGQACAARLLAMKYRVCGWSRRPKTLPEIAGYSGAEGLRTVVSGADVLVVLLPLTYETRGMIDRDLLASMKPESHFINVARGQLVQDDALLHALDHGPLSGATLDVFSTEPLPKDSPFWSHPKVFVTPHISSLSNAETAIPQMVENIRRLRAGQPILNTVDPQAGY